MPVPAFTGSEQTVVPQAHNQQGLRGDRRKIHVTTENSSTTRSQQACNCLVCSGIILDHSLCWEPGQIASGSPSPAYLSYRTDTPKNATCRTHPPASHLSLAHNTHRTCIQHYFSITRLGQPRISWSTHVLATLRVLNNTFLTTRIVSPFLSRAHGMCSNLPLGDGYCISLSCSNPRGRGRGSAMSHASVTKRLRRGTEIVV